MNTVKGIFSHASDEWGTPKQLFSRLNDIYDFDLDVAATEQNKMCDLYFTKENDALGLSWEGKCWCNPPYSCAGEFVKKAIDEIQNNDYCNVIVMLLPSRTDTAWFHELLTCRFASIEFIRGRLVFDGAKSTAPFPSIIVTLRKPSGR